MSTCGICGGEVASVHQFPSASLTLAVHSTTIRDSFNISAYTMRDGVIDLGQCAPEVCRSCAENAKRPGWFFSFFAKRDPCPNLSDADLFTAVGQDPAWRLNVYRVFVQKDKTITKSIRGIHQELVKLVAQHSGGSASTELSIRIPGDQEVRSVIRYNWEDLFLHAI